MNNKAVLITGSSKGLGKELALIFASYGYDIILHGRDTADLTMIKEKVFKKKVSCSIVKGDLRVNKTIRELFRIAKEKNISLLINNAGSHCPHLPLEKIKDNQINEILITNLVAPIRLTKRIYSLFLNKGYGTIININSLSGLKPQKLRSIYCASKWGLRGFTDSLKLESQKAGIRILGIYPGRIKTKPHFTFGMKPRQAAQKIYAAYKNSEINEVIIDKRCKTA